MDEELLAQPQVMRLLDSLREQYTKYQELCRLRNKRTQLDEIHSKVMQVLQHAHTHTHPRTHMRVRTDTCASVRLYYYTCEDINVLGSRFHDD